MSEADECFLLLVFMNSFSLVSRLSASPDEHNTGWKFYFKLYCFLDTDNVPKDSVEFAFMFEQVRHNQTVIFPL